MLLLDRAILGRFVANFALLLGLLFLFAVGIDSMVGLDEFVRAAKELAGEDASRLAIAWKFIVVTVGFHAPRFFQFFAYLHGLVAIGAMGFTLAQMHRHRELVATLAAGLSLHRMAMPFVVGAFLISLVQLVNQEFFLPRVAPLLLRQHGEIGQRAAGTFPVPLTPDGRGALLQATSFDPRSDTLTNVTVLVRDERGRTRRRMTAPSARWNVDADLPGWTLENGREIVLDETSDGRLSSSAGAREATFFGTDLSPEVILVRRHAQFAAMLSLGQIRRMLKAPDISERPQLLRHRYVRFASVLVNVLVMWLALPAFLVRIPPNLLRRTMLCAIIAIPAMIGAMVFMMAPLPGIPPAVGVFLPVLILTPIVLAQWTFVRS